MLSLLETYNPVHEFREVKEAYNLKDGKHIPTPEAFMSFWYAIGAAKTWLLVTTDMRNKTPAELGEIIACASGLHDSLDGNFERKPQPQTGSKRQMGLVRGQSGGNTSHIPRPYSQWNGITTLHYYASLSVMAEIMKYCDRHTSGHW